MHRLFRQPPAFQKEQAATVQQSGSIRRKAAILAGCVEAAPLAGGTAATVAPLIHSVRHADNSNSPLEDTDMLAGRNPRGSIPTVSRTTSVPSRESMELLAAGLLHDLNNQLSAVRMSSQLIARIADGVPEIQKRTDGIERSIQQARQLIASMAGLYAPSESQEANAEVDQVITETLQTVQESHLGSTRVEVITPSAPLLAQVKSSSLQRILQNLMINAGEAMEGKGCLRIQVERIRSLENLSLVLPPAHANSWIRISIMDSGPGIAPEAQHRLFTASYSTKNRTNRIGSGLGLFVVFTLSKEEGLGLGVQSKLGEGTRFDLVLPAISNPI